ncbi:MAG: peptidylprolyl isomerase [Flavobacteriaceae bacterium]|nr:peptidylprolyl isomerase [Flavobacteriaceae bacterium]
MKKLLLLIAAIAISTSSITAQKKKDVLMTIDGKAISAKEFKRVYTKNLELVQDENQKTVDGYLDLFVDYKLKVMEAFDQKLDQRETYKKDFSKYEEQLSRTYIYEDQVTEDLLREAYDRSREEIDASHILILCNFDATAQDTLAAYNKIKAIRAEALLGENFEKLVALRSEEPGKERSRGRLGYFSAFAMVYPFETMTYNTPVGEISEIVRTQYGYHIIKVNDRRKREPKIEIAHIMLSTRNDSLKQAEQRIKDIYSLLEQGQTFEDLANQYSDDRGSAVNGGKLRPFGKGDLKAPSFENAAYALENPGDIAGPLETPFGWHIIKLVKKGTNLSYEEAKPELEVKVRNGDRAKLIKNAVNNILKDKLNFTEEENLVYLEQHIGDEVLERKWKYEPVSDKDNKVLFSIDGKKIYFDEFAKYVEVRQKLSRPYTKKETLIDVFLDEYETQKLKEIFRSNLEATNEDYASVINEYRDGLLIFEVMSRNVWDQAKRDSIGQVAYYNKNQEKYLWKERVDAEIYSTPEASNVAKIKALLSEGKSGNEIRDALMVNKKAGVVVTQGKFELGDTKLPEGFAVKEGISETYKQNGSFTIVNVKSTLPAGPKSFEEVRGRIISDYQTEVETNWMDSLRAKYKVEVNNKTLKRLKKELDS